MDLVNEEHVPLLHGHEQADDVARALQGRGAGDPATGCQLCRQHHGHGGFAQAGRPVEQEVVQGVLAMPCRLQGNVQHLLEGALTDVVPQATRAQGFVCMALLLCRGLWAPLRTMERHCRTGRCATVTGWRRGGLPGRAAGDNGHGNNLAATPNARRRWKRRGRDSNPR